MGKSRYAIYYVPEPETPLWRFGSRVLGHDSATGDSMKPLKLKGIKADRLREITQAPRVYGFHATLKPPFRLSKEVDRKMLDEALEAFVAGHAPFKVPALELAELDGFIALRPKKSCTALDDFAAECVRSFDAFRAPPLKKELEKRLKADLSKRQKKNLEKWGYPFVMDDYRFHMTLTERLKDTERKAVFAALEHEAKDVLTGKAWTFDVITLLRQKGEKEPFEVVKCYPLTRSASSRWPVKKH